MNNTAERRQAAIEMLRTQGGYRSTATPLHVADIDYDFDFDAVLEGPNDQHNLVLVMDTSSAPVTAIERRLRAFSMALRRTGSTRPVTLVLFVDSRSPSDLTAIQQLCRVLPVDPDDQLDHELAPLLPLPVTSQAQTIVAARKALRDALARKLKFDADSDLVNDLIRAAGESHSAVEAAVLAAISKAATIPADGKETP